MARFRPGQSGNPNGRPRTGTSLAERIRQKGGDDGAVYVDLLHDIATNTTEPTRLRIEATKVLLQRGFGGIPQEVQIGEPLVIGASEIRRALEMTGFLNGPHEMQPSENEAVTRWIQSGNG